MRGSGLLIALASLVLQVSQVEKIGVHSFTFGYVSSCPVRVSDNKLIRGTVLLQATAEAEEAKEESTDVLLEMDKNGIYDLKTKDQHM